MEEVRRRREEESFAEGISACGFCVECLRGEPCIGITAEEVGVWRSPPGSRRGSVSSGRRAGGVGSAQFQQTNDEAERALARSRTAAAGPLDQTMTLSQLYKSPARGTRSGNGNFFAALSDKHKHRSPGALRRTVPKGAPAATGQP